MTPSIIVDSASSDIDYFGGTFWQAGTDPATFLGTYSSCRTDGFGKPTLYFNFHGTAVSFYGHASDDFKLNYTLGSFANIQGNTSFTHGLAGKTGVRWWGLDNLNNTINTLSLKPIAGQAILDYIVYTPSNSTLLAGKTLALDDSDSSIHYTGSWFSQSGTTFAGGLSYQDTRRGSNKTGDSFTIPFTGKSVSVYGLLNQQPGKLSSTYAIDGGPAITFTAFNGTQKSQPDNWLLHQKFFSKDVSDGPHNLTVTVGEVTGGQTFWLDYVLYNGTSATRLSPVKPSKPNVALITALVIMGIVFLLLGGCCRRHRKTIWIRVKGPAPYADFAPPPPPPPTQAPPFAQDYEAQRLRMEMENMRRENDMALLRAQQARQEEHEAQRLRMENLRLETEMIRLRTQQTVAPGAPQQAPVAAGHGREADAGPADAPPAYNANNYVP